MNILVDISLEIYLINSLVYIHRSRIARSMNQDILKDFDRWC